MLTDKTRKKILENFLQIIDGISDKEYQKRVWIRGEGPECIDFDETGWYFLFTGDDVIDRYKKFHLTELQCEILKRLRDQFRVFYKKNYWPSDFIESPEWAKIMELAKEVLKAFNYKKPYFSWLKNRWYRVKKFVKTHKKTLIIWAVAIILVQIYLLKNLS